MNTLFICSPFVIAGAVLTGCTTTVPVINASIECPIKEQDLVVKCAAPATITAGITYQDIIRIALEDRKNLAECENNRQFLQNAINACNTAIRNHNEKVEEFNKKFASKP